MCVYVSVCEFLIRKCITSVNGSTLSEIHLDWLRTNVITNYHHQNQHTQFCSTSAFIDIVYKSLVNDTRSVKNTNCAQ